MDTHTHQYTDSHAIPDLNSDGDADRHMDTHTHQYTDLHAIPNLDSDGDAAR
jgi:hypothetical protein